MMPIYYSSRIFLGAKDMHLTGEQVCYCPALNPQFTEERRGISMAKIDNAYAYYISTYAQKTVSRYDSHKKSELRKVYNKIVKINKDSPLYKIPNLTDAKKYAIDIKENARSIQNVVASLSDQYGSFEDSFKKKVAMSSDDEKVSVTYIGDGSEESKTNNFDIEVQRLATPQINQGRFLKDNTLSMRPGAYSFDLNTSGAAYEFQYNINSDETNLDVLDKLARLVNSSSLGITAEILSDGNGSSALKLTSIQTGLADNETELFSIAPDASTGSTEIMDQLGIDRITSPAQSSAFTLNGTSHSSLTNTFSINQVFELTLHQPTDSEKVNIGFKTDADAIADNIQSLVDAYNSILSTAAVYADTNASAGNKLQTEILSISGSSRSSLQDIGLVTNENGSISIDKEALREAVVPERDQNTFETLSQFRDSIGKEAENISINPMNYVNKIVVAYKNPGHNFATPYITSIYSGMMLDKYV